MKVLPIHVFENIRKRLIISDLQSLNISCKFAHDVLKDDLFQRRHILNSAFDVLFKAYIKVAQIIDKTLHYAMLYQDSRSLCVDIYINNVYQCSFSRNTFTMYNMNTNKSINIIGLDVIETIKYEMSNSFAHILKETITHTLNSEISIICSQNTIFQSLWEYIDMKEWQKSSSENKIDDDDSELMEQILDETALLIPLVINFVKAFNTYFNAQIDLYKSLKFS